MADFGEVSKGPRLPSTYYLSKSRPKGAKKILRLAPPPPITRFALNDPSHLSTHSGLIINMRNVVVVLIPII